MQKSSGEASLPALSCCETFTQISTWEGTVTLPAARGSRPFRLMIREYERMATDPVPGGLLALASSSRLVYAEAIVI